MGNLQHPRVIWLKGGLFVVLGSLAAGLLISRAPSWTNALLLGSAIWAFCRAYYFAFYVIEHYVDRQYRFAGLLDFIRYWRTGQTAEMSAAPELHSSSPRSAD